MRVLPVFARELRTESRQWFTYWLRVLGALAGLLTFAFTYYITSLVLTPQQLGGMLFSNVHTAVFVAIWLLVPLLTAECFLLGVLILFGVVRHTARHVARHWQEVPPTARRLWWERLFLEPRFWRRLLHARMRRMLERNPIGWLQQYRATARVAKWGWCLFFVVVDCLASGDTSCYDMAALHLWLGIFLLLGLSFSAAGSFRRERETGALELILVTPIRESQVIWGRLRGLWGQFLPAALLVAGLFLLIDLSDLRIASVVWPWRWRAVAGMSFLLVPLVSAFFSLSVVGLYFSLSRKTFLAAWLYTVSVAVLLPALTGFVLGLGLLIFDRTFALQNEMFRIAGLLTVLITSLLTQVTVASLCGHRLHHLLRQRQWSG